jgi:outer membrane protein OmpA-like peptidoglycan-associated protein
MAAGLHNEHHDREDHWIPLSDLMAGLMMVFLLVAVMYMIEVEAETDQIREVALVYEELKRELYEALYEEFREDLPKWQAELDRESLTISFGEPDVLFEIGSAELRPRFQEILSDFFPRYARILSSPEYRDDIEEIRIEGHTSSRWETTASEEESYFLNMQLSQARTRSALRYVLTLPEVREDVVWLRRLVTANGLSFSRLILTPDGEEDATASRRVEFRVRTNAEEKIAQIVEVSGDEER